jgi:hypothetical protein
MKFLDRMLTVFLARQNPDSTSAKPRFMKKTSDAVNTTQIVSSAIVSSSAVFAWAVDAHPRHTAATRAEQRNWRLARCIRSPCDRPSGGRKAPHVMTTDMPVVRVTG